MHSFTINCDTFLNEEKVAVVTVPVTSDEVTCSDVMLALFLYFVGKVFDKKTGKVSTRVNGWQYFTCMSTGECINYLVQFFTGRCQINSFSLTFTFSCVHKF